MAELIKTQGEEQATLGKRLSIDWVITSMCNYTCAYCPKHDPINKKNFSSFSDLRAAVDHLEAANREEYFFTFSGGEPTVHPHLADTIEYAREKMGSRLKRVDIITNGSRAGTFYDKLRDTVSESLVICLTVSLHVRFADVDHIKMLIAKLSDRVNISVQVLLDFEYLDRAFEICDELIEYRKDFAFAMNPILIMQKPTFLFHDPRYTDLHLELRRQKIADFAQAVQLGARSSVAPRPTESTLSWQYEDGTKRTLSRREVMDDRSSLRTEGYFDFKDMWCALGSRVLAINPDGICIGAQCNIARRQPSVNIFEEKPFSQDGVLQAVQCPLANCSCAVNDVIPKFSDQVEGEDFINKMRDQTKPLSGRWGMATFLTSRLRDFVARLG